MAGQTWERCSGFGQQPREEDIITQPLREPGSGASTLYGRALCPVCGRQSVWCRTQGVRGHKAAS